VFSGLVAGRWSGHTGLWCCSTCSSLHILLVPCPVEQFLGFFSENIYHSALYFLVGGTVCSYVCIQESTLQSNVWMSPCVISFVLLMLCTGLCALCLNWRVKFSSSGCNALVNCGVQNSVRVHHRRRWADWAGGRSGCSVLRCFVTPQGAGVEGWRWWSTNDRILRE
jgi:hypothetical protein